MLRLRPYKHCDAAAIVSWIGDELAFRKWSADRFDHYPITAEDLNAHYDAVKEADDFYEMTAFDESGAVGHLILRFVDAEKQVLRFGFVIVDPAKRGMGYGKEMLQLALRYAFEILKVEKVTLGVFDNNPAALHCYHAAGFREIPLPEPEYFTIGSEKWNCLELEITK